MNKTTDEIISIVQSVQHLTIADYGPTHAIFSDYNLSGALFYEAQSNVSGWLDVIRSETKDNRSELRLVIAEIEQIMKALDSLMNYSEADLEIASEDILEYGIAVEDTDDG